MRTALAVAMMCVVALSAISAVACDRAPSPRESLSARAARLQREQKEHVLQYPASYARNGRWIGIVEHPTFSVWVDSASLEGGGTAEPSGWILWVYKTTMLGTRDRAYSTEKQRFEAHCTDRTLRLANWVTYADSGAVVDTGTGDSSLAAVIPETVGERILSELCIGVSG